MSEMSVRMSEWKAGWAVAWLAAALLPVTSAVAQSPGDADVLDWTLKVEPAHSQSAEGNEVDLVLSARIQKGWILYSSDFQPADFGPRPARITVAGAVGPLQAIGASSKTDKSATGGYTYTYFSDTAQFRQRVRLETGARSVTGTINGQTCFEENGLCALFRKQFDLPVEAPAASKPADKAAARVELGKKLFFDARLSKDGSVSCATCHKPENAFADTTAVSLGVGGQKGTRNTPSVMNTSGRTTLFWDGRAETLEDQAIFPIENPVEMALPVAEALARVNADAEYTELFQAAFGAPATARNLGRAIAAYEKTLDTVNSPYDRYSHGDDAAISDSAKRGRLLFIGRGKCAECHSGEDFTSDRFRNIGLFDGAKLTDRGRGAITQAAAENGQFKVPSLRNVAVTAPYMHNGMFRSLREVIDYYDEPDKVVAGHQGRDASMSAKLSLTEQEKLDLEAFLRTLTDARFAS